MLMFDASTRRPLAAWRRDGHRRTARTAGVVSLIVNYDLFAIGGLISARS